jgi:hypothetical protein
MPPGFLGRIRLSELAGSAVIEMQSPQKSCRYSRTAKGGSLFDPSFMGRLQKAKFLEGLSDRISAPVLPDDEPLEYLPTQALADFLATEMNPPLDGIIYRSVQTGDDKTEHRTLPQLGQGTDFGHSQRHDFQHDPVQRRR